MHTIKLKVQDSIFDEIMYFLKKLPQNEVEIIEEKEVSQIEEDFIAYLLNKINSFLIMCNQNVTQYG